MNAIEVAAFTTALGSVTAGTISAIAAVRAARHSATIKQEVVTPLSEPSIAVMIPQLFEETFRQGRQLDRVTDRVDQHLKDHEAPNHANQSLGFPPSSSFWIRSDNGRESR